MDHKPPTAVIESAHGEHALPFHDTADFDNADRGFIAALSPCVIKAADGRVVWDNDAYSFLDGPRADVGAPQPVAAIDPDRQARPVRSGAGHLSGPRPRPLQHQLHRGRHRHHRHRPAWSPPRWPPRRWACTAPTGAADRPVVAVIYTHSHVDHFGGVLGVTSQADVDAGKVAGPGARGLHRARRAGERLRRHGDDAPRHLYVRHAAGARTAGTGRLRAGPGRRPPARSPSSSRPSTSGRPAKRTPSTASRSSSRWRPAPRRPPKCTSISRVSAHCAWPRTPPTTCTTC